MTGRYPMRYGLQTMQIQWSSEFGLPADERLLAQALQEAGYRTALIGKWQLGHARKELWPTQRGFDYFYGHLTGEIDYFKKTDRGGQPDWWRNDKRVKEDGLRHHPDGPARPSRLIGRHDRATPAVPVARVRRTTGAAAGTRRIASTTTTDVEDERQRLTAP